MKELAVLALSLIGLGGLIHWLSRRPKPPCDDCGQPIGENPYCDNCIDWSAYP